MQTLERINKHYYSIIRKKQESTKDSFEKFVKTDTIIGDSEIVRIENTIRINDEAIVFGFGNVDTDIEHREPPLVIWE